MRRDALARILVPASLFYLALPCLLFCAGWLEESLAFVCTGLVVLALAGCVRAARRAAGPGEEPGEPLGPRHLLLLSLVGLLLLGVSGVGGIGYQEGDWRKHNSVLHDLVERPWPVVYDLGEGDAPLVYYVAYYLPAAALGKAGGWTLANLALFSWTLVGFVLAGLWALVLARRAAWTVVLCFVAFSGLDVVGQSICALAVLPFYPEIAPILRWDHLEQWPIAWQYSANVTQLFWVPNQALAGWIAGGLLMHAAPRLRARVGLFVVGPVALWSPFVAVGLAPILAAGLLSGDDGPAARLKPYVSLPNLCGAALLAVVGLYYAAKLQPVPGLPPGDIPHGFVLSYAPDAVVALLGVVLLLVFCLLEFGLYGILLHRAGRRSRADRALLGSALVVLSLLPLYRYGDINELGMRTSIPALFVLAVLVARALHDRAAPRRVRVLLALLLAIGAATPLVEVHRQVSRIAAKGTIWQLPSEERVTGLDEWDVSTEWDAMILRQYVGGPGSFFFEHLARGR